MNKLFSMLAFLLFSLTSLYGQDIFIKEFITQAAKQIVKPELAYYNLVDLSFQTAVRSPQHILYNLKFLKQNPGFPTTLLSATDSTVINWCDYKLCKANCTSKDKLPKYPHGAKMIRFVPYDTPKATLDSLNNLKTGELNVPVKKRWTWRRMCREGDKVWEKHIASFKAEDVYNYQFSTPVFSERKDYAIISVKMGSGGKSYILKYENQKWLVLTDFDWWAN